MKKAYIYFTLALMLMFGCTKQRTPMAVIIEKSTDLNLEANPSDIQLAGNTKQIPILQVEVVHDSIWYYEQVFQELKAMLKEEIPLNFKRAVFVTENVYLNNAIDYDGFKKVIAYDTMLCHNIRSYARLKEYRHWKDSANIATNEAIFSFLMRPVQLAENIPILLHAPYTFNFSDCFGDSDWANTFVLKTLLTNKGNCRSLTFLYKILADEMGTQSSLALAPNHIYIKQKCKKLLTYNTELTSGLNPIDGWIMAANYISLESVQQGVYMKTLTDKQNIAVCLLDLAEGYKRKFKNDTARFILKCANLALEYHPKYIDALQLKGRTNKKIYDRTKSKTAYAKMDSSYVAIVNFGYQEMPEWEYQQWLRDMDNEKNKYTLRRPQDSGANPGLYYGHDDKQLAIKHNPYKSLGFKPPKMISLSNGKYEEYFEYNDLVPIDDVVISRKKNAICKLVHNKKLRQDGISRWMSPDPLAQQFPSVSPYMSLGDNPILYVDPGGKANVVYLVFFPSSYAKIGIMRAGVIAAETEQYYKNTLNLNVKVIPFGDASSFNPDYMDKSDAVVLLGNAKEEINYVKKYFNNNPYSIASTISSHFAEDPYNPETSQNPGSNKGSIPGKFVCIDIDREEYAANNFLMCNSNKAFELTIMHGTGHNSGINHPFGGIMTDGDRMFYCLMNPDARGPYPNPGIGKPELAAHSNIDAFLSKENNVDEAATMKGKFNSPMPVDNYSKNKDKAKYTPFLTDSY